VNALTDELGVAKASSWLYIGYEVWGQIDSVYAVGVQDGAAFGPIDDSNPQTVESTFVDVMSRVGVNRENAFDFALLHVAFGESGISSSRLSADMRT